MKLGLAGAFAAAVLSLTLPATSAASEFIRYGVQDDAYLSVDPSLDARLGTLDDLGAELVRTMVSWRQVAPTRPRHPTDPADRAYDWTRTDAVLEGLHAHGMRCS